MKYVLATIFILFFVSNCLGDLLGSITGSANAAAGNAHVSGSAAGSVSLATPIQGLLNLPSHYVGALLQRATGTLGLIHPAVSIIADLNLGSLLSLGASADLSNVFAQNGATVSVNISLPTCGILSAVTKTTGLSGITNPVISVVDNLASHLTQLVAQITSDISIGNTLGIVCTAAPGCSVSLTNVRINGIRVSEDLNISPSSITNSLSVIITNDLLTTCNFQITANLAINCNVGVTDITSCRFLFELVNGLIGGLGL